MLGGSRSWIAFSCLCLFGASRWLLPDLDSRGTADPTVRLVASLLAASFAWTRVSREPKPPIRRLLRAAGGGASLLLGLELTSLGTPVGTPSITASDATIALALCPVVIAVAASALRREGSRNLSVQLWPGLAAVTGLLLLLPEPSIRGVFSDLLLLGFPLLAGTGAVLVSEGDEALAWIRAAALSGALFGTCAGSLLQAKISPPMLAPWTWSLGRASAMEALSLFLSFTVLLTLGARRWSAIFVAVPLLLSLEGLLLLQPPLSGRPFTGMGLLLFSAVSLLLPNTVEEDPVKRLFG